MSQSPAMHYLEDFDYESEQSSKSPASTLGPTDASLIIKPPSTLASNTQLQALGVIFGWGNFTPAIPSL